MKNIYPIIKNNPLFNGIEAREFERMLLCIEGRTRNYNKDDIVLMTGGKFNFVGLILFGGVRIIKEDSNGNTLILTELSASELFGEAFASAGIERSPVTVTASQKSGILFFDYRKVITTCSAACEYHSRLIGNMLGIMARKNLMLNQKIEILSKRTTREKLLAFLYAQGGDGKKFTIPYNREEMAAYLCVDRSAMSKELCKMRDEGLIKFSKNVFEIL